MTLHELQRLGFVYSGTCLLVNERLQIEIMANSEEKNVLYAYVQNEIIKYVGYTENSLSNRILGYKRPSTGQRTNLRINANILQILTNAGSVDVYCFANPEPMYYRGLQLDVAAGLELSLVKAAAQYHRENRLEPLWNIRGNRYFNQALEIPVQIGAAHELLEEDQNYLEQNLPVNQRQYPLDVEVTLNYTYFNKGLFNLPVRVTDLVGRNRESITVDLVGGGFEPIIDRFIDRTTNSNRTPRFYLGSCFKDWAEEKYQQGERFVVRILSPTHLQLI